MTGSSMNSGIDLASLESAFSGSEDVLGQMLDLFCVQAVERMAQLHAGLSAWDQMGTRGVLHSLVNISGAVRAYGMSDLSKAVGDAIKRDDRPGALALASALAREAALVQCQAQALLAAVRANPATMWGIVLPTGADHPAQ